MNELFLKRYATLLLLCIVFFFLGNSLVHLTDPDEVFYAQTAKEMASRHQWMTPYIFDRPQFEKPPLTYWFIKFAFVMFGQSPFAARFFPAVFASLGVLAVYAFGLLGFGREPRAFLSAFILCTSAFYVGMGKTVFTDMIFSVFILYALLSFYLSVCNKACKVGGILGFYFFIALAILTKGPLGLFIPFGTVVVFLIYQRQLSLLADRWFIIGFVLCLVIAMPWYVGMIKQYGQVFIHEFFYNDHWRRVAEAEHKGNDHFYFYPLTIIAGMFPWSLLLVAALGDLFKRLKGRVKPFEYFLLSWMLVVFVIFQIAHSKLASYLLPLFPALALLTGNFIEEKLETLNTAVIKKSSYALMSFLVVLSIASLAAYKAYRFYLSSLIPVYWLSASLLILVGISLILLVKQRMHQAVRLLGFSLVPILSTGFLITSSLEPHVSMYEACLYVPSGAMRKTVILTSKPYARGVRYYTDQDVAVMDLNGTNYFSPHPILILNTSKKLLAFLKSQSTTFAILKKSHYEYLKKNYADDFRFSILKVSGRNYVLKIALVKSS